MVVRVGVHIYYTMALEEDRKGFQVFWQNLAILRS